MLATKAALRPPGQVCVNGACCALLRSAVTICGSMQRGRGRGLRGGWGWGLPLAKREDLSTPAFPLQEEVRVLSKFRHPNLVILMGFARNGSGFPEITRDARDLSRARAPKRPERLPLNTFRRSDIQKRVVF